MSDQPLSESDQRPWYSGITRYQWTILIIASLGWIFDVFEGQIFVATMNEAMGSLLPDSVAQLQPDSKANYIYYYTQITFAAFLVGGALGGIIFGMLADRIGRKRAMSLTILMYSLFTCVSAISAAWWHFAAFRFLVAMGVGGEWAVASALVAEVFPKRARAWSLGIFHASSVLGSYLAIAAGQFIVNNQSLQRSLSSWAESVPLLSGIDPATIPWRFSFILGAIPALLILWIRRSVREPDRWEAARKKSDQAHQLGRLSDLLVHPQLRNVIVGTLLASVGMATFWGVFVFGKELPRAELVRHYYGKNLGEVQRAARINNEIEAATPTARHRFVADFPEDGEKFDEAVIELRAVVSQNNQLPRDDELINPAPNVAARRIVVEEVHRSLNHKVKSWEMLAMFLTTTGGGLGLICFGPICESIGRRKTFVIYHLAGFVIALICVALTKQLTLLYFLLPIFGFFTMGMHAGYAIYFPELFPTRLRSTGSGVCFNLGRLFAAPVLILTAYMGGVWKMTTDVKVAALASLYLLAIPILLFARETKGEDLPE